MCGRVPWLPLCLLPWRGCQRMVGEFWQQFATRHEAVRLLCHILGSCASDLRAGRLVPVMLIQKVPAQRCLCSRQLKVYVKQLNSCVSPIFFSIQDLSSSLSSRRTQSASLSDGSVHSMTTRTGLELPSFVHRMHGILFTIQYQIKQAFSKPRATHSTNN